MDQKFHYPTWLWRGGGGGPDPFIVKDYEKGPFFFAALPNGGVDNDDGDANINSDDGDDDDDDDGDANVNSDVLSTLCSTVRKAS